MTDSFQERCRRFVNGCQVAIGQCFEDKANVPAAAVRLSRDAPQCDVPRGEHCDDAFSACGSGSSGSLLRNPSTAEGTSRGCRSRTLLEKHASTTRLRTHMVSDCRRIDRCLKDPSMTLSKTAHELHISTSHLSRLVASRAGIEFHCDLEYPRLKEASRLLRHSQLRIKVITGAVRYSQVRHFDRAFKRW
jgi:AraC-like DNA-binding protein